MKLLLSKIWPIGLGAIVIGMALLVSTFVVKNHFDQETNGEAFLPIIEKLEFSFTPHHNNLNIVILRLKNQGLLNNDQYTAEIKQDSQVVVTQQFSGSNIGGLTELRLQFPPMPDSKDQRLTVSLSPLTVSKFPLMVGMNTKGEILLQTFYRGNLIPRAFFESFKDLRFLLVWGGTMTLLLLCIKN